MLQINLTISQQGETLDPMKHKRDNRKSHGNHGVSDECRMHGFKPAFMDRETGAIYLSRYTDGRLAPLHLLEGLPEEIVTKRQPDGTVASVKKSLQSGFVKSGKFYTREQAAFNVTQDVAG